MFARHGILILVVVLSIVSVGSIATTGRQPLTPQIQPAQQGPDPNFPPINGRHRGGATDDAPFPRHDPQIRLKEAQKKISSDVEQLLQLATELKDESAKTKETEVLSLPLIHKAEEIEKLAKQIKDLARAN